MDKVILGLAYKYIYPWLQYKLQPQAQQPGNISYSERDQALLSLKRKEGAVIVILGTRGMGKTELAYRLAEFLGKPTYAVSPEQKPHPGFITEINLDEVEERIPPRSTLICDDVPAWMSNRDYSDSFVKMLEKMIPMVRHKKKIHLIFNAQSSAAADKYILDCDMAFFKPLGLLYDDLERPNIRRIYKNNVDEHFEGKDEAWIVRHAVMWSRTFKGVIEIKKVS